jgi:hypothetical protein
MITIVTYVSTKILRRLNVSQINGFRPNNVEQDFKLRWDQSDSHCKNPCPLSQNILGCKLIKLTKIKDVSTKILCWLNVSQTNGF